MNHLVFAGFTEGRRFLHCKATGCVSALARWTMPGGCRGPGLSRACREGMTASCAVEADHEPPLGREHLCGNMGVSQKWQALGSVGSLPYSNCVPGNGRPSLHFGASETMKDMSCSWVTKFRNNIVLN